LTDVHDGGEYKVRLNDSVAVVTGGASGLGLAAAAALHDRGATVVIADLPTSAGPTAAADLGRDVLFAPADVCDEAAVEAALDIAQSVGELRVVVNCAGVGISRRVLSRAGAHSTADFTRVIGVNLIGTFNVVRSAAARMTTNTLDGGERGVIVNTASIAAYDGQIGQVAYSASKGGVAAMTLPLARDLASHAVRVMAIAPGLFETPLLGVLPEAALNAMTSVIPHPQRLGRPEEFGRLVVHIAENPMLNGEVVRLDAALRMPAR
jgi:NAD(P)-dependent dehydrogenase (short-subunit alcohol dehydrogenase family)